MVSVWMPKKKPKSARLHMPLLACSLGISLSFMLGTPANAACHNTKYSQKLSLRDLARCICCGKLHVTVVCRTEQQDIIDLPIAAVTAAITAAAPPTATSASTACHCCCSSNDHADVDDRDCSHHQHRFSVVITPLLPTLLSPNGNQH